jgi:hypothetical protein
VGPSLPQLVKEAGTSQASKQQRLLGILQRVEAAEKAALARLQEAQKKFAKDNNITLK